MRRAVHFICLPAAIVIGSACTPRTLPISGRDVPVSISITCSADTLRALIYPYLVRVPEGDGVSWTLVESPGVTTFEISKKSVNAPWPYPGSGTARGDGKEPAIARGMKAGQVDRRFSYNISATCADEKGEPHKVVIDPDMMVIRR